MVCAYTANDLQLLAQGRFILGLGASTKAVIERAKNIRDGDIFIVNDPYLGGTHLNDVAIYAPRVGGERVFQSGVDQVGDVLPGGATTGCVPALHGVGTGGVFGQRAAAQQFGKLVGHQLTITAAENPADHLHRSARGRSVTWHP